MISSATVFYSTPSLIFVRGYNTSGVGLEFRVTNMDNVVDVAYLSNNTRQNFVVGTFLTGSNTSVVNVGVNNSTPLTNAFNNSAMARQSIAPGSSATLSVTFPNDILVPRQPCAQRKWLCVYVVPGTLASYNLTTDVINCIDLTSYVNCLGL
jgi:hypothetical protein